MRDITLALSEYILPSPHCVRIPRALGRPLPSAVRSKSSLRTRTGFAVEECPDVFVALPTKSWAQIYSDYFAYRLGSNSSVLGPGRCYAPFLLVRWATGPWWFTEWPSPKTYYQVRPRTGR